MKALKRAVRADLWNVGGRRREDGREVACMDRRPAVQGAKSKTNDARPERPRLMVPGGGRADALTERNQRFPRREANRLDVVQGLHLANAV
jgi:hypothetical protein